MSLPKLTVFGYGSLPWYQNFEFDLQQTGYVKGFKRTFYQLSIKHRGTEQRPGRCATLIEDPNGEVWGVMFTITGEEKIRKAEEHLGLREKTLGGYREVKTDFYPRDDPSNPVRVIMYVATPENKLFDAEPDLDKLAHQIATASGPTGTSAEYLLRTAEYFRQNIPEERDEHMFELERRVIQILNSQLENTNGRVRYIENQ